MENLNAEQIKKALECCTDNHATADCEHCPYEMASANCMVALMKDTLTLIKELTEENERLKLAPKIGSVSVPEALTIINKYCESHIKKAKSDTVRKMREWLQERVKGIYLDEGELFEILNEYEKQISEDS